MPITISIAERHDEIYQILSLQTDNHVSEISTEKALTEGFVTLKHDFSILLKMNQTSPHIIAKDGNKLVGYILCMLSEFSKDVEGLLPMFEEINKHTYEGTPLKTQKYMIMGQICVHVDYRGQGIFNKLYETLKVQMSPKFDLCVTEVADRNKRSLKAHLKIGFEVLKTHISPDGELWNILIWRW